MGTALIPRCIVALAFAVAWSAASGQVVVGAGVGLVYGVPVYGVPVYGVPLYGAPWVWPYAGLGAGYPGYYRAPGIAPSCLRIGRCTVTELEIYYRQPEMLERRAPAPPGAPVPGALPTHVFGPDVEPTPDEDVQPDFRGASRPRDEYSESGKPIAR